VCVWVCVFVCVCVCVCVCEQASLWLQMTPVHPTGQSQPFLPALQRPPLEQSSHVRLQSWPNVSSRHTEPRTQSTAHTQHQRMHLYIIIYYYIYIFRANLSRVLSFTSVFLCIFYDCFQSDYTAF